MRSIETDFADYFCVGDNANGGGKVNVVNYELCIGAMAQCMILSPLRGIVPIWLFVLIALVPWLVIHVVTFTRVPPPISPRAMRMCFIVPMCWYLIDTIIVETLLLSGVVQPHPNPIMNVIFQVLMLGAMFTFVYFLRAVRMIGRYEIEATDQFGTELKSNPSKK